ncbi:DUF177 domain-containing protein [Quadrisphaera sp. DSM 44207]|uniref:YceD family protein n=1 Tax=Quadrisphaera sp. DSM 44207 TaxID=1881057 RepID=UPI00089124E4|nr:YceD family protein [Quadrisphaera sp. DSM 44207]SDQ75557.1 uncharacterized protein SAMN05428996_2683 [Quadrisphaera sp. DSM 44207]
MKHLDLRSPLVLDTHDLGRRAGASQRLTRTVPAPADLGTEVVRVPEGSDLQLDLLLESVVEGVLVSGAVRGRTAGECVRCLDDVQRELDVRLQELFAYPGKSSTEDEDTHELQGDHIDLEPVLRDAVVPALPFQPVCRADCPGLCSECGARLEEDPGHAHESVDPRWAALTTLTTEQTQRPEDRPADDEE